MRVASLVVRVLTAALMLCSTQCSLPFSAVFGKRGISIVSYNAQNLCDATDDGQEYPEFTISRGT